MPMNPGPPGTETAMATIAVSDSAPRTHGTGHPKPDRERVDHGEPDRRGALQAGESIGELVGGSQQRGGDLHRERLQDQLEHGDGSGRKPL
jgi:hypothetical protein